MALVLQSTTPTDMGTMPWLSARGPSGVTRIDPGPLWSADFPVREQFLWHGREESWDRWTTSADLIQLIQFGGAEDEVEIGSSVLIRDYGTLSELDAVDPILALTRRLRIDFGLDLGTRAWAFWFEEDDSGEPKAFCQVTVAGLDQDSLLELEDAVADWLYEEFPRTEGRLIVYLRRAEAGGLQG